MVVKVNGGILNEQTLTGSLRYFKMAGPFSWTVSDGTVNLPVKVGANSAGSSNYFAVGVDKSVPNSAAELALQEISKQCSFAVIAVVGTYDAPPEIHFACPASAFGWGSDTPDYQVAPANAAEDLTAAAPAMQVAVRALGNKTVYVSIGGAADATAAPVTAVANLNTVTIVEVPFALV